MDLASHSFMCLPAFVYTALNILTANTSHNLKKMFGKIYLNTDPEQKQCKLMYKFLLAGHRDCMQYANVYCP